MVGTDQAEPADIVDRLLWREARDMLGQHAGADPGQCCVWCGYRWPCASRRLAERAAIAARRPWREAWTLRHDLNSMRMVTGLRAGRDGNGGGRRARRAARHRSGMNRGWFI